MSTADRAAAFAAMLKMDPDGWIGREPTEADYEAFKAWAIRNYSEALYNSYMTPGWIPEEDRI